jgi:hypothetical protein
MPDDEMFGRSRYAYRLDHRQTWGAVSRRRSTGTAFPTIITGRI